MIREFKNGFVMLGDCMAQMALLPNGYVDVVMTDPPYGKKASKGTNGFGSASNRRYADDWDKSRPPKACFDRLLELAPAHLIFGGNYFADLLPPSNCWIVWDKKGQHQFKNPFADAELVWTSFTRVVKRYVHVQQGFVRDSKEERFHPTQKPVALMREIVRDFSKPGDVVLDPFLGSGTTAIAAVLEGRKFIGIEKEREYFDIACARIEEAENSGN